MSCFRFSKRVISKGRGDALPFATTVARGTSARSTASKAAMAQTAAMPAKCQRRGRKNRATNSEIQEFCCAGSSAMTLSRMASSFGVAEAWRSNRISEGFFIVLPQAAQSFFGVVDSRFNGADLGIGNGSDFLKGKVFDEMQEENGALRRRQFVERHHELLLLLFAKEQIEGAVVKGDRGNSDFFTPCFFAPADAPALDAFLVSNSEEPASKLRVLAEAGNVANSANEGFLDDIKTGLLVVDQFGNVNIKRQLVAPEKNVPGGRGPGPGFRHGKLFALGHYHIYTEWNGRGEKRFKETTVQFSTWRRGQVA